MRKSKTPILNALEFSVGSGVLNAQSCLQNLEIALESGIEAIEPSAQRRSILKLI